MLSLFRNKHGERILCCASAVARAAHREMSHGGHGHGHGGGGGGHGHAHGGHDCSQEVKADELDRGQSLYGEISIENVRALNEEEPGSARNCIKPFEEVLDETRVLRSDEDDAELILFVPFRANVRVRTVCIVGGRGGTSPSSVLLWTNREDIDFDAAREVPPEQRIDLAAGAEPGPVDYPLVPHRFSNVASLTMFFPDASGADQTVLSFVGFRGESLGIARVGAIAGLVYEANANPADHEKAGAENAQHSQIGQ